MTLEEYRSNEDLRGLWNQTMKEPHMAVWLQALAETFQIPKQSLPQIPGLNLTEFMGLTAMKWSGQSEMLMAIRETGTIPKPKENLAPTPEERSRGFAHTDMIDEEP